MGNLFNSIKGFISSLTLTDFTLIIAIIVLIILIITLLYVQRNDESKDIDLSKIKEDIIVNNKPKTISLSEYEEEQEEKAIISYEELLQNTGQYKLNYEEEIDEGISIKKVDTENISLELPKLNNKFSKEEEYLNKLKKLKNDLN